MLRIMGLRRESPGMTLEAADIPYLLIFKLEKQVVIE
jgi:hypothetical protein